MTTRSNSKSRTVSGAANAPDDLGVRAKGEPAKEREKSETAKDKDETSAS